MAVKLVPAALVVVAAGLIIWRGSFPPPSSPSVSSTAVPSADDIQIDYQNAVKVAVSFLPVESRDLATFLVQVNSDGPDLSGYDIKGNLVLADGEINPLPTTEIKVDRQTPSSITARATFAKFQGNHFHFLVNNLGGIRNRVLHFYHAL